MTGRYYLTSDPTCPLKAVTCMADQTNIYYNTQLEVHPNRISWDISTWRRVVKLRIRAYPDNFRKLKTKYFLPEIR